MIELKNINLQIADKSLLEDTNVRLGQHQRIGLVGRNGSGKSTLLRLILGEVAQASGQVFSPIAKQDMGYLAQNLPNTTLTAIDFVKSGDWRWTELQAELAKAEAENNGEKIALCFSHLQEIDGYTIDTRAAKILNGLGFSNEELTQPVKKFSGGWQMRLQIAKVLLSNADLLLLDEPTNHLDIDAIIWLGNWLTRQNSMQIIISHDRDFLDDVCTHTLHLHQKTLKLYSGNYSQFQKQYAETLLVNQRTQEKAEAQRTHMEAFINRFRAKASKARQVQSRIKALEKLEYSIIAQDENIYEFNFHVDTPITGPLITIKGNVGYSDKVLLPHLNFSLYAEERIGIVGRNGLGKTTLLNTLAGKQALVSGDAFRHQKLKIGYYAQNQADQFNPEDTPLSILLKRENSLTEKQARSLLGRIGFSGNRVMEPIKNFSGGERSRLALALLDYQKPQLLVLDEPTNHLDMESKEALIMALLKFQGALVVVSHDRHFMSSVVNQIYYINHQKLNALESNDWKNL